MAAKLDLTRLHNSQGLLEFSPIALVALKKAKLPPCPAGSGACACETLCRRSVKWPRLLSKGNVQEALADLERLSGLSSAAVADGLMTGFECVELDRQIATAEVLMRGALGMSVSMRVGATAESCANRAEHAAGCRCWNLNRHLANEAAELGGAL